MRRTAAVPSRELLLRRAVILPQDLFADLAELARLDGYSSVQAWVVVQLQARSNERRGCSAPKRVRVRQPVS